MGLSRSFIDAHIAAWEQKLSGPAYPHRNKWPSRLFHHAPLENAICILKSGRLLSRNDSTGIRIRDIAAPSVIDSSIRAHKFVRLYFRPRTPTQYHVEGIRKSGECPYGETSHAPVLIMFVLDAKRILSMEETHFSNSNMQSGVLEQSSQEYFMEIPFDKVYHEGGIGGDTSITKHRCAEVLAQSPLDLRECLQWVYCRSDAERMTLISCLGSHADNWKNQIIVSDDLKVFEKRFAFVDSVSLSYEGVRFSISARSDMKDLSFRMTVNDSNGHCIARFRNETMPTNRMSTNWLSKMELSPGKYQIIIRLEEQLAFDAWLNLDYSPF